MIISQSVGAFIAMHFAAQFPKMVAELVLIGPGRTRSNDPDATAFTLSMANLARKVGMPALAAGSVSKNVAPSSSSVVRAFVREVVSSQDSEGTLGCVKPFVMSRMSIQICLDYMPYMYYRW